MTGRKYENLILGNIAIKDFTGIFQVPGVTGCFLIFFLGKRTLRKFFIILDALKIG